MESFFSLLRKYILDCQRRLKRRELRLAITTWIKRTYTTADIGKDCWKTHANPR